jgi:hypothetical protein
MARQTHRDDGQAAQKAQRTRNPDLRSPTTRLPRNHLRSHQIRHSMVTLQLPYPCKSTILPTRSQLPPSRRQMQINNSSSTSNGGYSLSVPSSTTLRTS